MNYNSIQEIFDAGITNMQVIRNNSRNDDSTDTLNGVSWFKFNNVVASNIYVSGNTWFGFGTNSEQLRVNRRDTAVWWEYREEGTLFNLYKFLKIRWKGVSVYNQDVNSHNYMYEYDVILWDTGDISLHMISFPSNNFDGTFNLQVGNQTVTYSKPTAEKPDVTFYTQNDSGTSFVAVSEVISTLHTEEELFLIGSGSSIYTIENGVLVELQEKVLTKQVFLNHGLQFAYRPTGEDLLQLKDPVLYYFDADASKLHVVEAKMKAVPPTQVLQTDDYFMNEEFYVNGVKDVSIVSTGDVKFAFSFDRGMSWEIYSGGSWIQPDNPSQWMTPDVVKGISEEVLTSKFLETRRFRIGVRISGSDASVTSVVVNYK